jgi:hypothetical protein
MFMADPKTMYRADGSKVTAPRQPNWKTEILGLWIALRTDPTILLLFPMFLASVSDIVKYTRATLTECCMRRIGSVSLN